MNATVADVISGTAKWCAVHGDSRDVLPTLASASIHAVVTDPIYPEIDRHYGRMTEAAWWEMMITGAHAIVPEVRRVLAPRGSAVFIIQPNSERVGRMRSWGFDFMSWIAREWNLVQDAYWWNFAALPKGEGIKRERGLMRPSVKPCVWAGEEDCWRDQDAVLWTPSDRIACNVWEDRARRFPHGRRSTVNTGKMAKIAAERGGVTPFNLIPLTNADSYESSGAEGHGAGTPYDLAAWWIRYICPPGGIVLDPFGGAGTMARAAVDHGRRCILIERDPESIPRIERTMNRPEIRAAEKAAAIGQTTIFDMVARP